MKVITNPKQAAVLQAILESVELLGPTLKEWRGTKELMDLLLPSEYELILRLLTEQGYIQADVTRIMLAHEADKPGLPAYDITVDVDKLGDHTAPPEGVVLDGTTLFIDGRAIKLGRGAHHYTLEYWVVTLTMKKPNKPILEIAVLDKYGDDEAPSRSVVDATRRLNKKITTTTGIERLFECSNGRVSYHPDRLK